MKLVRDKIPDIYPEGNYAQYSSAYHKDLLELKLEEEVKEYVADRTPEELADILEVIYTLAAKFHGLSQEQLETIRLKKHEERGGFETMTVLIN